MCIGFYVLNEHRLARVTLGLDTILWEWAMRAGCTE